MAFATTESGALRYAPLNSNIFDRPLPGRLHLIRRAARQNRAPPRHNAGFQWEQIARSGFQSWQDKQSHESTDMGFYGYEVMYPMDFFTVMQQLDQPK